MTRPWRRGEVRAADQWSPEAAVSELAAVSPEAWAGALDSVLRDHELFTLAPVFLGTPFDRDLLAEAVLHGVVPRGSLRLLVVDPPLFGGLPDSRIAGTKVSWREGLYAVLRESWMSLRDACSGITLFRRKPWYYGRIGYYSLQVPWKESVVPVTVFGASTTEGRIGLGVSGGAVRLRREPPEPEILAEAQRVRASMEA